MDPNKIIDRLGGTGKVAEICERTPGAVSQWRKRVGGIPRHHLRFLRAIKPKIFKELERNDR